MFTNYNNQLKSFIKKVLIFCLPILVIFAFFDFLVVYSGELMPTQKVIEIQFNSSEPVVFGRKWAGHEAAEYKYLATLQKKPQILALGSSRILQIRQEMFNDQYSFYNAGLLLENFQQFVDFIKLLPEDYQPQIIILGLDVWNFSEEREIKYKLADNIKSGSPFSNWGAHVYVTRKLFIESLTNSEVIKNIFKKREPFSNQRFIGLHALGGSGFRADGSRWYGKYMEEMKHNPKFVDRELPPIIERIKQGINPFQYNYHLGQEKMDILEEFLKLSKEKGITLIGLAPPFSIESFEELTTSPYQQELFSDFQTQVPELFDQYGFSYFDFSNITDLGVNNNYMFDGFHISETAMSRILFEIFNSPALTQSLPKAKMVASYLEEKLLDPKTTPIEINW